MHRDYPTPIWPLPEREAAIARFRDVAKRLRALAVEAARAIGEVKLTGAHWKGGSASISEFAERNGMSGQDARTFENVGSAFARFPEAEERLLDGRLTVGGAAVLGEVARMPEGFFRPDDRWVEWAEKEDVRTFRRRFEARRDEHRTGEPVHTVVAHVTAKTRDDLFRSRVLLSRGAVHFLTVGQTLGFVLSDWLREHDPLLVKPGVRRCPDTSLTPGSRYVPKEVDRAVRVRDDDRCIVPFCTTPFDVERAHLVAYRDGGDQEVTNLVMLCGFHNFLQWMGDIVITGPADAPIVLDRNGEALGTRFRPELGCEGPPEIVVGREEEQIEALYRALTDEPERERPWRPPDEPWGLDEPEIAPREGTGDAPPGDALPPDAEPRAPP